MPDEHRQHGSEKPDRAEEDTQLVRDVAKMLVEWEGADELASEFAERLVKLIRSRSE